MRDNFRREYIKQQNIRSGSGGKSSHVYCNYTELQFLKPVMQLRQTESNMSSDTEEDADQTQVDDEHMDETLLLLTMMLKIHQSQRKPVHKNKYQDPDQKKNKHTQEFIVVVKNLITSQRNESGEIASFAKSLIPQREKVEQGLQCDMRIDMITLIQSYQQRSGSASVHSQSFELPNPNHHGGYANQVTAGTSYENRNMSYPPIGSGQVLLPQYTNGRFHGGPFDPPLYRPPTQHPPPPPREDPHPLPRCYQDL